MVSLVARKRMTYNHRRLEAGDEFEVENDLHVRVLVVRRRAKLAPKREKSAAKPHAPDPVAPAPEPSPEPFTWAPRPQTGRAVSDVSVTAVSAPRRGPGRPRRVSPESSS